MQSNLQAGQLGSFRNEILNWAANLTKNDLEWTSSVPDNDGQIKRGIFNYQRIKRIYLIAQQSKPDSILEALAHNQLIEAYAYWTKLPGYTEKGRQQFFDKVRNIIESNQTMVLYGLSNQSILESKIIEQLTNELKTISEQKLEEYQNNLQELNNLKALRTEERKIMQQNNESMYKQLNELKNTLIQKDLALSALKTQFQDAINDERKNYQNQLELAIQNAKDAIQKYKSISMEFNQAKVQYEERTVQLAKKFKERIITLQKEQAQYIQKYKKINDLFTDLKRILEEAIKYYEEQRTIVSASFFGYSSGPSYEAISIKLFEYMVQMASLIGIHSRIFSNTE